MINQTISHYKILERLGGGGMGIVYKAEDTKLKRKVALKFLPPELTRDEVAIERFIQEAQAASALDHLNICTVYEINETNDGQMFITMACYEGETLKEKIKRGPLNIEEAINTSIQVAQGLTKAHAQGIIHRDIKPANIFITTDSVVKIVDFGLAKLTGHTRITKLGSTLGTTAYMSPEQIRGDDVDHRTDIWSLGIVLYEMISGQLPFHGEHEAAIMYEILNLDAKAIKSIRSDVPNQLEIIILEMLQKDASKRPNSASEVIHRLKESLTATALPDTEKSIAVLYFENMSSEKDSDYFCAGITEDIITDLSKAKGLKVISRTDVLPFRNKEVNIRQLGESLRVNYILEGSIRKAGNKIRITVQLVDVKSGFHIWADRFDRLVEDIFDLQDEVSQKTVDALRVSLSSSEKESLVHRTTNDLRAYDFYMRGRDLLERRGMKSTESAIQMFQNALLIDNSFASAYAALAEAYTCMYEYYDGRSYWLTQAIDMNEKALVLDPGSIEARFGIAMVFFHQKRFTEAKKILDQIIQDNPEHYDAQLQLGMLLEIMGEPDPAIQYYERSAEIKPYSEEPWMHLSDAYEKKGDSAAAKNASERKLAVIQERLKVDPNDIITLSRLPLSFFKCGDKEKAIEILKKISTLDPSDPLAQYNCACGYAVLGMKTEALMHLRKAFESGWKGLPGWVQTDSDLDSLRDEPEFKELLVRFIE
jgi:serine/threonine protein kinase/thioredoxin-like negative regulator of GroEL